MKTIIYISTLLLAISFSSSISAQEQLSEKQLYKQAINKNSIEFCEAYLSTYPDGKYKAKIEDELDRLHFVEAYNQAGITFKDDLLKAYLTNHPQGKFINKAQHQLEVLHWQQARYTNTKESYNNYLKNYPTGIASGLAKQYLSFI